MDHRGTRVFNPIPAAAPLRMRPAARGALLAVFTVGFPRFRPRRNGGHVVAAATGGRCVLGGVHRGGNLRSPAFSPGVIEVLRCTVGTESGTGVTRCVVVQRETSSLDSWRWNKKLPRRCPQITQGTPPKTKSPYCHTKTAPPTRNMPTTEEPLFSEQLCPEKFNQHKPQDHFSLLLHVKFVPINDHAPPSLAQFTAVMN